MITTDTTLSNEEWHDRMIVIQGLEKDKKRGMAAFHELNMPHLAQRHEDYYDDLIAELHPVKSLELISSNKISYELQEN